MNTETDVTNRENGNSRPIPVAPAQDYSLALRIACWGGTLVLAIGYAVVLPMKSRGFLPEMTWIRLIVGPALMVGGVPAPIAIAIYFPKHQGLAFCILVIVYTTVVLGITLLESSFLR
jgi:hypothetical protein